MNRLLQLFLFPYLFTKGTRLFNEAKKKKLPGERFFYFGRALAWRLLFKVHFSPKLFLNPVSIVRYFEFEFVRKNLEHSRELKILDVSSPYLMSFYLNIHSSHSIHYINPDSEDLRDVQTKHQKLGLKNFKADNFNSLALPFQDFFFDSVISISVIEHIANNEDSAALKEMWRVLKPGGKLILTFPVKARFTEEFIEKDIYGLNHDLKKDTYFFQRYYDEQAIRNRILSIVPDSHTESMTIFGEKEMGFFDEYQKRWIENGFLETIHDPKYIAEAFDFYENCDQLPGSGVMGITLIKKR